MLSKIGILNLQGCKLEAQYTQYSSTNKYNTQQSLFGKYNNLRTSKKFDPSFYHYNLALASKRINIDTLYIITSFNDIGDLKTLSNGLHTVGTFTVASTDKSGSKQGVTYNLYITVNNPTTSARSGASAATAASSGAATAPVNVPVVPTSISTTIRLNPTSTGGYGTGQSVFFGVNSAGTNDLGYFITQLKNLLLTHTGGVDWKSHDRTLTWTVHSVGGWKPHMEIMATKGQVIDSTKINNLDNQIISGITSSNIKAIPSRQGSFVIGLDLTGLISSQLLTSIGATKTNNLHITIGYTQDSKIINNPTLQNQYIQYLQSYIDDIRILGGGNY